MKKINSSVREVGPFIGQTTECGEPAALARPSRFALARGQKPSGRWPIHALPLDGRGAFPEVCSIEPEVCRLAGGRH